MQLHNFTSCFSRFSGQKKARLGKDRPIHQCQVLIRRNRGDIPHHPAALADFATASASRVLVISRQCQQKIALQQTGKERGVRVLEDCERQSVSVVADAPLPNAEKYCE